jgi:hypothetical protein
MYITYIGFVNNIENIPGIYNIPSCNLLAFFCFAIDLIILVLKIP